MAAKRKKQMKAERVRTKKRGSGLLWLGGLTLRDRFCVLLLGAGLTPLAHLWSLPGYPFELSEDLAIAAGLRPPYTPTPELWNSLAAGVFHFWEIDFGFRILKWMGHVALGLEALFAYLLLNEAMPGALKPWITRAGWSRRIIRTMVLLGTFLFACSDPIWRTGQFFSPTTFHLLLSLIAVFLFFRGLRTQRIVRLFVPMAIAGVLASETPAGIVIGLSMLVICRVVAERDADNWTNPLANPVVRVIAMRRMTIVFTAAWLLGFVANTVFFYRMGGAEALDWDGFYYVLHYLHQYVKAAMGTATPSGWFMLTLTVIVPLVFSQVLLGGAVDDDRFLPYAHGLFFFFMGVFAFLQLSGWHPFWFWTWIDSPTMVESDYLLGICCFVNTVTFTCACFVLGVEVYFRNYRRIATLRYQDAVEESRFGQKMVSSFRPLDRLKRTAHIFAPVVVAALVLPYRAQPTARRMAGVVDDYLRATSEECGNADLLFTDGAMDAAVEFGAARQGRTLKVVSLMAGSAAREIYLRTRGVEDEEDRSMLASGAIDALRTWAKVKPERMKGVVLQMGTEMWRRGKMPVKACGGFLTCPLGLPDGVAEKGRVNAIALANRVLEIYDQSEPMGVPNARLKNMFLLVQWRLARMAQMRATAFDLEKRTAEAMEETERVGKLDDLNASLQRIRRKMNWAGQQLSARLTPREGLKIGLDRADFRLARTFAQRILASDPGDVASNFAMGMSYFEEESYARAEIYLKRCLEGRPNEPTLLNNLAITQLRMGDLAAAESNAVRAVELHPDLVETRQTLNEIRRRRQQDKD